MVNQPARVRRRRAGFTLIELLVVLGIVSLMLTLAVPHYLPRIDRAKETVLAENLRNVRDTLAQFYGDTGRYPDNLQQLVDQKYLAALPLDPLTESNSSWLLVPPEDGIKGAVANIRSGAAGADRSGKAYAEW